MNWMQGSSRLMELYHGWKVAIPASFVAVANGWLDFSMNRDRVEIYLPEGM